MARRINRRRCLTVLTAGLAIILCLQSQPGMAQSDPLMQQMYRMAGDYERLGYYERAAEQYAILFEKQPFNTAYYRGLKRNLERLGRYDRVVEVIRRRLAVVDDASGRSDLGSALYRLGRKEEAMQVWQRTLTRFPKNVGAYSLVAAAMITNGLFDEAIAVYQRGRKALNNPFLFSIEIANAYSQQGQFSRATTEFLNYLQQNPRQLPYIQRRILTFFDQAENQDILRAVEKALHARKPPREEILKIYASCLKRLNRYDDALDIYLQLEERRSGKRNQGGELYNFANEAVRANQIEVALKAYRHIIENWPASPYLFSSRMGLAEAYSTLKQYDQAIAILDEILQSRAPRVFKFRAMKMKGDILLNHLRDPEKAISVFETLYESYYRDARARKKAAMALGDSYVRIGKFEHARKWYERALKLSKAKEQSLRNAIKFNLARLEFYQGRFQRSIAMLEEIEPTENDGAAEEDLVNDALDLTLFIEQALPDSNTALPEYIKAEKFRIQGRPDSAAAILSHLVEIYPTSRVTPRALLMLAELYRELNQFEREIETYEKLIEHYPNSLYIDLAIFSLAQALERQGNTAQAVKMYEKLLVEYPQSIYLEDARQKLRSLQKRTGQMF